MTLHNRPTRSRRKKMGPTSYYTGIPGSLPPTPKGRSTISHIHTHLTTTALANKPNNKILHKPPPALIPIHPFPGAHAPLSHNSAPENTPLSTHSNTSSTPLIRQTAPRAQTQSTPQSISSSTAQHSPRTAQHTTSHHYKTSGQPPYVPSVS